MSAVEAESASPERKKLRLEMAALPTQVVVASPVCVGEKMKKEEEEREERNGMESASPGVLFSSFDEPDSAAIAALQSGGLFEFISKNILGPVFKMEDLPGMLTAAVSPTEVLSACAKTNPSIPGAVAVAASPTAALFPEGDWSWHRNPAASIRSGGTNKQTPVWKYFVYSKAENLSRCIVGDCTYMLKGPHTSTLACHLKKHPQQYSEYQKLKLEYTRERTGSAGSGQLPPSPASSSSASSSISTTVTPKHEDNNNITPSETGAASLLRRRPPSQLPSLPVPLSTPPATALTPAAILQPHGMSVGSNGQLVATKKWRREERRQRELEGRLSLFLSAARLPSSVIRDPFLKDFLECAQPKFSCPTDVFVIEQLMASQHSRLQCQLRARLASSSRHSLLLDVLRLPSLDNSPPQWRLAVSASSFSPPSECQLHVFLLAVRPLDISSGNAAQVVRAVTEAVLSDYGFNIGDLSRVLISGMEEILENPNENVFGQKQLVPWSSGLHGSLLQIIEANPLCEDLKKSFYAMILSLVTQPGALQALTKAVGKMVNLPLTESFINLLEAVLAIKSDLVAVLASCELDGLSEQQWKMSEQICSLLSRLEPRPSTGGHSSAVDTIDTVVPSLMQMLVSLEDSSALGGLAVQLTAELRRRVSRVINVNDSEIDPAFLQATALNPQLLVLLDDDQQAFAKNAIIATLQERIRTQEEAASRKQSKTYLGVDSLLAAVIDRRGVADSAEGTPPTSTRYPDLHAAQLKKKTASDRQCCGGGAKSRLAEAIVHSYFDEVCSEESYSSRHLPPLSFWQLNAHRWQELADLASELLSVPAVTPGVERIFGRAGERLSLLLHPERLERDSLLRFNRTFAPTNF